MLAGLELPEALAASSMAGAGPAKVAAKCRMVRRLSMARNSHFHSPRTRIHVLSTRQEPPSVALVPADLLLQPRA